MFVFRVGYYAEVAEELALPVGYYVAVAELIALLADYYVAVAELIALQAVYYVAVVELIAWLADYYVVFAQEKRGDFAVIGAPEVFVVACSVVRRFGSDCVVVGMSVDA